MVAAPLLDSSSGCACTAMSRNGPSPPLSAPMDRAAGCGCPAPASAGSRCASSVCAAALPRLGDDMRSIPLDGRVQRHLVAALGRCAARRPTLARDGCLDSNSETGAGIPPGGRAVIDIGVVFEILIWPVDG